MIKERTLYLLTPYEGCILPHTRWGVAFQAMLSEVSPVISALSS